MHSPIIRYNDDETTLTMKKYLMRIGIIFSVTFCYAQDDTLIWNKKLEEKHLQNRQDTAMWDKELLRRDIEANKDRISKPMRMGAFPVPRYELLGKESLKG